MSDSRCKPILHQGVTYPSQIALARALGVSASAVSAAVLQGRLDGLGTGLPGCNQGKASAARCLPVAAAGHAWPSQLACARDLGVTDCVVNRAVAAGRFESWATGRLYRLGRITGPAPRRADPYAFPPDAFACGQGFCPAALRMMWPIRAIRVGEIAGMARVTPATIWTRVEQLGITGQRPGKRKHRYSPALLRALWADDSLSLAEIGARLGGMHPVNVGKRGARLGLPPRRLGPKPSVEIGPEFDLMWSMGVKSQEIARFYGLSQPRISRIVRGRGLQLRIPPAPQGRLTLAHFREWQLGQRMAQGAAETRAAMVLSEMVDAPTRFARAA